jgi:predicted RNA binding protein YcfA (HicA-like mRNA interferase family)
MSRLPLLTARELMKILFSLGFELKRQKGSHKFFRHSDGRTTIVPDHGSESIDRGLLNKIIKQDLLMSIDEFLSIK